MTLIVACIGFLASANSPQVLWTFDAQSNLYAPPIVVDICPNPGLCALELKKPYEGAFSLRVDNFGKYAEVVCEPIRLEPGLRSICVKGAVKPLGLRDAGLTVSWSGLSGEIQSARIYKIDVALDFVDFVDEARGRSLSMLSTMSTCFLPAGKEVDYTFPRSHWSFSHADRHRHAGLRRDWQSGGAFALTGDP